MEPEGSLPHSQVPTTCPYPSQLDLVRTPTSHFLKIHLNIILPSTSASSKWSLSFLLTPWSRVLLEKLTVFQLLKKFPTFYGTRKFITAFTSARNLSLSWANSIQFIPPHSNSWSRTRISVQVRGFHCKRFVTGYVSTVASCLHLTLTPSWRTTPCLLSATAYSIYSQLPSILETVPTSATWVHAMPWWQGPTDRGSLNTV